MQKNIWRVLLKIYFSAWLWFFSQKLLEYICKKSCKFKHKQVFAYKAVSVRQSYELNICFQHTSLKNVTEHKIMENNSTELAIIMYSYIIS